MKIALAQMRVSSDVEANYRKSISLIRTASLSGANLIIFPEIHLTPFFPQYAGLDASEYVLNSDSEYITGICDACQKYHIFASPNLYIEEDNHRYDMSLLINDSGEIIGKQKMVHVAQCEMFYEQDYYTPSEEGFNVFDTPFGKIGIVVCFDRHYPESIRTEALRGAELIVIPTANTIAEPSDIFQWEIRIQAFQNCVHVAMCNRVGTEGNMTFSGESVVADYNGEIVALTGTDEELLIAEVDVSKAKELRMRKPYICLRRRDLYD